MICYRCGANLSHPPTEQLVLASGGYTLYNDNGKNIDRFSSCKIFFTNCRFIIYKIKPQAKNPAFGLIKDLANVIIKRPCISIDLSDIEWVRRYDIKYVINTNTGAQCVWLPKSKGFDELFAPYMHLGEE